MRLKAAFALAVALGGMPCAHAWVTSPSHPLFWASAQNVSGSGDVPLPADEAKIDAMLVDRSKTEKDFMPLVAPATTSSIHQTGLPYIESCRKEAGGGLSPAFMRACVEQGQKKVRQMFAAACLTTVGVLSGGVIALLRKYA